MKVKGDTMAIARSASRAGRAALLLVVGALLLAPAGDTPVTVHVTYSKAMTPGEDYFGELLIGPPSAPSALSVPVTIHRD
jgi:hypothetical protein